MLHKTKVSPEYSQYVPNAELIEEFFYENGTANQINEILWDMFAESISNPNAPTDAKENAKRSYLYKQLTELLIVLEPKNPAEQFENNDN